MNEIIDTVLKIQLPLAGADLALIYNEDRSIMLQVPVDEVENLFDAGEQKVYYNAKYNKETEVLEVRDFVGTDLNW